MAVDYRKQYTPEQLEPFWPNEILRMGVVTLSTLAVITILAVLPVILNRWGLGHWLEASEPANPRATPAHIRPEWYFLAAYQYLKLTPQELLGMSGKTLGVLSQGLIALAVVLVPLWARRWSHRPPGPLHRFLVTLTIVLFVAFTLWAAWPPSIPMIVMSCLVVVLFYVLLARERRKIRRLLHGRWDWSR